MRGAAPGAGFSIARAAGARLLLLVPAQDVVVAIKGYDPVAYFTDGHPVQGLPDFEYVWDDHVYRFASAKHRDMFNRNPELENKIGTELPIPNVRSSVANGGRIGLEAGPLSQWLFSVLA